MWRVEFFKIGKCDFTFIREMRVNAALTTDEKWILIFFVSQQSEQKVGPIDNLSGDVKICQNAFLISAHNA